MKAYDFSLPADNGENVSLSDYKGKKVVLYFYPKDSTPGCTQEACSFRDNFSRLTAKGVVVLGISKDSIKRHENTRLLQQSGVFICLLTHSHMDGQSVYRPCTRRCRCLSAHSPPCSARP